LNRQEERYVRNEWLFREVNERIAEVNEKFEVEGETEFLCECGQQTCFETLLLTPAQYEAIRREVSGSSSCQATKTAASSAWSTASRASSSSRKSGKPARSRRSRTPARRPTPPLRARTTKGLAPQTNPFA
jgi:hypothetical protein